MTRLQTKLGELFYVYRRADQNQRIVLFIPGFGGDSCYYNFKSIIDRLPPECGYLAIDTIGTGRSIQSYMERSTETILQNLIAVLKEEQITSVTLVGHSMGGSYALLFAYRYPELVEQILVIEPTYNGVKALVIAETKEQQHQTPESIQKAKNEGELTIEDFLAVVNPNNLPGERLENATIFFAAYGNQSLLYEDDHVLKVLEDLEIVEQNVPKKKIVILATNERLTEYQHSLFLKSTTVHLYSVAGNHYLQWSAVPFVSMHVNQLLTSEK
ncbi:MAG: alpha/beta hydrolase [Enterococcus italicus]|uniref:alpha/beta hydrolase n=1 Tax=Enterococcus italicus TaxID=246144 RepID=UPI003995B9BF